MDHGLSRHSRSVRRVNLYVSGPGQRDWRDRPTVRVVSIGVGPWRLVELGLYGRCNTGADTARESGGAGVLEVRRAD